MRKQTIFNQIVNYDPNTKEIEVLDYVFYDSDNFHGATGTRFEPVSRDEFERVTEREYLIEHLMFGCDLPKNYLRTGFEGWVDDIIANGEEGDIMFDQSYAELWDYLREELDLDEDEAYIFNCTGGGRMFDENYHGNYNEELSAIIREYEKKN